MAGDRFSLIVAVLIMLLAVSSLPFPSSMALVGSAAVGAVVAVVRIHRARRAIRTVVDLKSQDPRE